MVDKITLEGEAHQRCAHSDYHWSIVGQRLGNDQAAGACCIKPTSALPQEYTPVADGKNQDDNNQSSQDALRSWVDVRGSVLVIHSNTTKAKEKSIKWFAVPQ